MVWLSTLVQNPWYVFLLCLAYLLTYYGISGLCIWAEQRKGHTSAWKKNSPLDIITSVLWTVAAVILIWSLIELCVTQQISLGYLIVYYILFIFLFACCYGILDWHFPGMLEGVRSLTWEGELQCLVMSLQTQTTLGYTRAKPNKLFTEFVTCGQALLGLFFCIVFIARAVNLMTPVGK